MQARVGGQELSGRRVCMYTGTMIDELIGIVAKAETTVEIRKNIEEETRWMPMYAAPNFDELYRETLLAGVA